MIAFGASFALLCILGYVWTWLVRRWFRRTWKKIIVRSAYGFGYMIPIPWWVRGHDDFVAWRRKGGRRWAILRAFLRRYGTRHTSTATL